MTTFRRAANIAAGLKDLAPWVFGIVCATTGVQRLFKVDQRDAAILGLIIAVNVQPGTIILRDEWTAYNCIPNLAAANGATLSLNWETINHSVNFVDPITVVHTQKNIK